MLKRIEVGRGKLISNSGYIAIWKYCFKIMLSNLFQQRKERLHTKFFHRKSKAVKNWRSRAWSIDPKVTKLTIIESEESNAVDTQITELTARPHTCADRPPQWLEVYPQYCDAIADMEQFS
jgi:hypothetical protein